MKKRLKSISDALRGVGFLLSSETNARIHLFATIVVIVLGILTGLNAFEWIAIIFCIGIVFTAEAFNTAIEHLCDLVSPDQDPRIGKIKDLAAGAVVVTAITAVAIGLIVFGRQLWCC